MVDHLAAAARREGERARQQHHGGRSSCWRSALFIAVGATHLNAGELHAVRAQRLHRHPSGRGDRLLRLHRLRRDLDGGRGDARPAAQPADRHSRRAGHLHGDLRHRRLRADRHGAVHRARRSPIRWRTRCSSPASQTVGWIVALGAAVSMTAVLLVFQYGQPRIFFAMARDGLLPQWAAQLAPDSAHSVHDDAHHRESSWRVASLIGDAAETYDLTNIGTLFAFALVCDRRARAARHRARSAAAVQGAVRLAGGAAERRRLPVHHGRAAETGLGAVRPLAGDRHR